MSYTPSSAWANTNNPPILQTATAVTIADGRGGVGDARRYSYSGGSTITLEKRFMGFRYEKETPALHRRASRRARTPRPGIARTTAPTSKPERIDRRTGSGQLLTSKLYEYTTNGATVPWTSLQTGNWDYTYIDTGAACPGADCKRKYTSRTFNAYGEVTAEVDYGNYDVTGDEKTVSTTFVPNTSRVHRQQAGRREDVPGRRHRRRAAQRDAHLLRRRGDLEPGSVGGACRPRRAAGCRARARLSRRRKEYDTLGQRHRRGQRARRADDVRVRRDLPPVHDLDDQRAEPVDHHDVGRAVRRADADARTSTARRRR